MNWNCKFCAVLKRKNRHATAVIFFHIFKFRETNPSGFKPIRCRERVDREENREMSGWRWSMMVTLDVVRLYSERNIDRNLFFNFFSKGPTCGFSYKFNEKWIFSDDTNKTLMFDFSLSKSWCWWQFFRYFLKVSLTPNEHSQKNCGFGQPDIFIRIWLVT